MGEVPIYDRPQKPGGVPDGVYQGEEEVQNREGWVPQKLKCSPVGSITGEHPVGENGEHGLYALYYPDNNLVFVNNPVDGGSATTPSVMNVELPSAIADHINVSFPVLIRMATGGELIGGIDFSGNLLRVFGQTGGYLSNWRKIYLNGVSVNLGQSIYYPRKEF